MNCIGATLTVVSFAAVVWTHHTTPFISRLRESARCVTRPKNGCERDYSYCCSFNREKIKIIRPQLVTSKIWFRLILLRKANWNSVLPPIEPNQRYIWRSMYLWRYIDQEKRIIFKRGLLDWLLLIWTLPSLCKIRDKMQVVLLNK